MELALGMSCLLHQRADDENLISRAEILPETSLALGSAIPVLSPCCCPGFKHHGIVQLSSAGSLLGLGLCFAYVLLLSLAGFCIALIVNISLWT